MPELTHHLAQLNVARLRAPIDDPLIADFVAALDRINDLAEVSDGFVWRLQDDSGNATHIQAYDDPLMIVNLSVWESLEHLKAFVYRSDHLPVMRRRRNWFHTPDGPYLVLWWVPVGYRPDPSEARDRLAQLESDGPGPEAFTFQKAFEPPVA